MQGRSPHAGYAMSMSFLKLIVLACVTMSASAPREIGSAPVELTFMTFNIRYGTADDGPNSWTFRRDMVIDRLHETDADVVGLQEALRFQLDEIREALPRYAEIGVGRDDGATEGEYSAILYRHERFGVAESGTFWLSETPWEVGSRSWGNSITRICTWARLIDLESGQGVYVFNTHLDHQSQRSREESVELIASRIALRGTDDPVILMGDLNAGEDNAAVEFLLGTRESATGEDEHAASPGLIDTFRAVHPEATGVGTFSDFVFGRTGGAKIDHVMASRGVEVLEAGIDRASRERRYPSDHFPVWARIRLQR